MNRVPIRISCCSFPKSAARPVSCRLCSSRSSRRRTAALIFPRRRQRNPPPIASEGSQSPREKTNVCDDAATTVNNDGSDDDADDFRSSEHEAANKAVTSASVTKRTAVALMAQDYTSPGYKGMDDEMNLKRWRRGKRVKENEATGGVAPGLLYKLLRWALILGNGAHATASCAGE